MPSTAANRYKIKVQAEGALVAIQAYAVISLIGNWYILVTFPFVASFQEVTWGKGDQNALAGVTGQCCLQLQAQDERWGQTIKSQGPAPESHFHQWGVTSFPPPCSSAPPAGEHWVEHTVYGVSLQTTTHNSRPSELFTVHNHDSSLKFHTFGLRHIHLSF